MRRCRLSLVASLATLFATADAFAQTATQVVRFEVNAISRMGIAGTPATLVVGTATAGSQPSSVTVGGTSYSITTNEANQKITASIDQVMPAGVTLEVNLAAPAGAASAGTVSLGTAAADVVTGITALSATALPINYRLSATTSAQVTGPSSRTVTYTIVAGT